MRAIPSQMQARLDASATTFCHCWRAIRRDGVLVCLTDHDRDLVIEGLAYAAQAGFDRTAGESHLGLSVGGSELSGALSLAGLDEPSLANGLWDGATVETWLVDWQEPSQKLLLDLSTISEVRRGEFGFVAELRSQAHRLDQETGRRFQRSCSADLGDAWCRVTLDQAALRLRTEVIAQIAPTQVIVSAPVHQSGWFTGGTLSVLSGDNSGASVTLKAHYREDGAARVELWLPLAKPFQSGDNVELLAGCDKSFATCGEKFGNAENFRGFPHIPGNEILIVPSTDAPMDGASLYR